MSTPRKHHFVPKAYLAAWTDDGAIDGQLQVIDRSTGKAWAVKPVNAARETDLYMIEVSEVEDDIEATEIETTFGSIEHAAAPILKRVLAGESMVSGEDRESVMAFLIAARMSSDVGRHQSEWQRGGPLRPGNGDQTPHSRPAEPRAGLQDPR